MYRAFRFSVGICCGALLSAPLLTYAFPFGGPIIEYHPCFNTALYALTGAPRGGPYIWISSTQTFQFGPPQHVGQYILGIAAPPYYCIVTLEPIFVLPGILMTMEGSSH